MAFHPPSWTAPVAVAALVTGAVGLSGASGAAAAPALPERSAAQLLADVAERTADPLPVVGTGRVTTDLGLPDVPDGHGEPLGPGALLGGENELRVWDDGDARQRLALVSDLAEWSALRDGRDLWTWSSDRRTGAHLQLPAHDPVTHDGAEDAEMGLVPTTPQEAAEQVLAAIDGTTDVSVDTTAVVADRPAYTLVVDPRDDTTLVGSVRLSVDAETSTPLGVEVTAAGATDPALAVAFDDVTFTQPDADVFAPPADGVVEVPVPSKDDVQGRLAGLKERLATAPRPEVVGSGWSRVLVLTAPPEDEDAGSDGGAAQGPEGTEPDEPSLLDGLAARVPEGRAFQTPLLTALATDDGRLLVGSVPVEVLQAAAAPTP